MTDMASVVFSTVQRSTPAWAVMMHTSCTREQSGHSLVMADVCVNWTSNADGSQNPMATSYTI